MTKDASSNEWTLQHDRLATLGMLSAGLAHEINNPLAYVLANLRFLSREILDWKTQLSSENPLPVDAKSLLSEWANVVSESIEGMQNINKLVKDMKGFARGDASQFEWFELQEVVDSSLRIVRHELKHQAAIEKHFDAVLPCLQGSPSQIQQVFVNLLMNAAQAMESPPGVLGKVDIVLTRKGAGISVTVKDNGRGVPEEYKEKIFKPFFTSKASGKGTGLGLFICKQLVALHGGYMQLESQLGEGTAVHLWLPIQNLRAPTEELPIVPM